MPIQVQCSCGQSYSVPDDAAGKVTRCRACRGKLTVPGLELPIATPITKDLRMREPWFHDPDKVVTVLVRAMVFAGLILAGISFALAFLLYYVASALKTPRPPTF